LRGNVEGILKEHSGTKAPAENIQGTFREHRHLQGTLRVGTLREHWGIFRGH
jgi:hypothetical protein